jgi:hypothetical protein
MDEIQKEIVRMAEQEILKNLMYINIYKKEIADNTAKNNSYNRSIHALEQRNSEIIEKYSYIQNGNN